jgi:hypothetical protein|tara:strand:+ start:2668 stop:2913 length:246 start_codon:yes stop_codon:yes gene_type:complete
MDSFQLIIFGFFGVVTYFIVTDENVAALFYYQFESANTYIRKKWWWVTNNPKNPVVKYLIYRRSLKMARELMAEINKDKGN